MTIDFLSLPLNGRRGLAADIIHNTIDPFHIIDDLTGNMS